MQGFIASAVYCLLTAVLCCFLGGTVVAETIVLEGNYGLTRQQPDAADLYDATQATANVEQGTNNTCWNIRPKDLPQRAEFVGGRCIGVGKNRTWPRKPLYDQGNGAGLRSEIRDFTVRRFYSEYAWDPIKPAATNDRWTILDSWVRSGRDDCIEADHNPDWIVVRHSLFEDCHTLISVTPGGGRHLEHPATIEFHDSVLSIGCMLDDNKACLERDTRAGYPWARPYDPATDTGGRGSSAPFKVRGFGDDAGCGHGITIRFRGNHFMAGASIAAPGPDGEFYTSDDLWQEDGFHTPARNLDFFQCMEVTPDSTDNTFYWLGGCDFEGFTMVQLHGACVPQEFNLSPAQWTAASNSREQWLAVRAKWIAEVWESGGTTP